jgi:hypothetical protein
MFIMRIFLSFLLAFVVVNVSAQTPVVRGTVDQEALYNWGMTVQNYIKFKQKDTATLWHSKKSDIVRHTDGILYYFDGSFYKPFGGSGGGGGGDADSSIFVTQYQLDTAKTNIYNLLNDKLETEVDPTVAAHIKAITSGNISDWNSAFIDASFDNGTRVLTLTRSSGSPKTVTIPADGGGGGGSTNLSLGTRTGTTMDVNSSTGSAVTLLASNATQAGLMTATQFNKLDGLFNLTPSTTITIVGTEARRTAISGGDISASANSNIYTIVNSAVTNAKMADMAPDRIKGRIGTTGAPQDLTPAQIRTMINVADGADVSVNADWNAVSGKAQILNKPTINNYTWEKYEGVLSSGNISGNIVTVTGIGGTPILTEEWKVLVNGMQVLYSAVGFSGTTMTINMTTAKFTIAAGDAVMISFYK